MANIDTLPKDIYDVLTNDTDHRITPEQEGELAERLVSPFQRAVNNEVREKKDKVIYASELGKKCLRQVYYNNKHKDEAEPIQGHARFKFLYGDFLEEIVLELSKVAGHRVEGEQTVYEHELDDGWRIRGRNDAIIDGNMVDAKSASKFAYAKYTKEGVQPHNDSFGYLEQIAFYWHEAVAAGQISEDTAPYFLFVNKELGKVAVIRANIDDVKPYSRALEIIEVLEADEPPPRFDGYKVPEGKSGNEKLSINCSYCPFKSKCHPNLRTFLYSSGPMFLVTVAREPKVQELFT